MSAEQSIELIRSLCESVGHNIAVWHRGGKAERSGRRQAKSIIDVFTALTGRKPTEQELDTMSATAVYGG